MDNLKHVPFFNLLDGTEQALIVGILCAIIIGLVPSIAAFFRARREQRFLKATNEMRLIYTVYQDENGQLHVHRH